jgi:acetyltransferase-like isoleucine patch superfamily enzyme
MMLNLIFVLLALSYSKLIIVALVYPWQSFTYHAWKRNGSLLRILSIPYKGVLSLTYSGWEKFSMVYISKLPSKHLRKWAYSGLGAELGKNVVLRYQTEIWCPYKLKIGRGSIVGYNNLLDARNGIEIGEHVNFSANVSVYTEQHDYRDIDFACSKTEKKMVRIGTRAWIGPNVIILPGVTIGEGAVCAAGCVVTKDVEPFTVVAGVPAKKVNDRPTNLRYEFDGRESRIY